jgi:serine/threonine protein kinase
MRVDEQLEPAGDGAAPAPDDSRVIGAVQEYLAALEAGRRPDRQAFLQGHADIAGALAACLDGLEFLHGAAPRLSAPAAPSAVGARSPDALVGVRSPDRAPADGPRELGDFRLVREVGRGGMGVVYEAVQLSLGRRVALKVLPFAAALDARQLQRFKNEAQAAAHLHHPHIVPVHGVGCERGVPYYAMEYIEGQTLAQLIDTLRQPGSIWAQSGDHAPVADTAPQAAVATKRSSADPAQSRAAAILAVQAAEALEHAHQQGVIHRDIKPGNLLVDAHGDLWVTDFGLALVQGDAHLTMTGELVGTLRYMSPEQALGRRAPLDHRTDIYSLGATLYELLTLEPAFTGQDRRELLRQIAFEEPRPPRRLDKQMPHDLETIALKAMAKLPEERYATAQELADDLKRFLEDRPIRARPPTLWQKTYKWSRRHRALVTVGVVALAVISIVGLASTALVWRAYRAEGVQLARAERAEESTRADADRARQGEEKARRSDAEARKRLGQLEKGNQIITSIFADLDIRKVKEGTEPLEAVLAKRLVKAAVDLEGEAVGDPLVVAGLQDRLGESLLGLGHPQEAIPLFIKAQEIRTTRLGAEHPDTLNTKGRLATGYQDSGRLDLALPLFEETLKLMKAKLGADHPDTLSSMNNLGLAYKLAGKLDLAIPLLEETLRLMKAKQGADHPETLESMNNLASAYQEAGQLDRALPLFEETLKVVKARRGADHPDTLTIMGNLALAYRQAGNLDSALPLMEETRKLQTTKLGADHPGTLISLSNLASAYQDAQKLDKALPLFEETLRLMKARHGADHPNTLISMGNLALCYLDAGKPDQALPLSEEALKLVMAKEGPDHPSTFRSLNNPARAYQAAGKLDRALPLFQQAAAGMEKMHFQHQYARGILKNLFGCHERLKQFDQAEVWRRKWLAVVKSRSGADSAPYAAELTALGLNLLQQQKWIEAESVLRESLTIRQQREPDAWTTFDTKSTLAGALLGQKKYPDAEPLLLAGYEGLRKREGRIPVADRGRLAEARERLVQLYDAWGKKAQADQWRQRQPSGK